MPAVAHIGNSRWVSLIRHHSIFLSRFTTDTQIIRAPSQNRHHPRNRVKSTSYSQNQTQMQSLVSLIKSCSQYSHLLQIHAYVISTSLLQLPFISLPFLSRVALSPLRSLSYSRQVFDHLSDPYVSHYNTMIRAYSLSNSAEEGFNIYQELRRRGIHANALSSMFVIKCCVKFCSLNGGEQIHGCLLKDGHQSDSLLLTTLMDLYSNCEKGEEACKVFDEMPQRDTVSWNVLISCYLRNRRTRDALVLFDSMKSGAYGCQPDDVTCLLILQACTSLGALEFGEGVHRYIEERGYGNALNLSHSLIAMYSRCGCLERAYGVFEGIRNKNVVSWSAMISGFAMNGYGREAIEAFVEMQRLGILPDEQTFTGVLCACSHCGFVDEGMMFFDRMRKEFGIMPNIRHYGCMVDLLGRAGRLDEAYQFIVSMGIKPDSTIWRTLLGACRIHRHFTLGERIIGHLIELRAAEAGDYVLLLNIYSSIGNWDKVSELRAFMKEKGFQTTPGCSTIEVKGVVHEFVADDYSHLRNDEIYEKLDEINKQLKIAGYVAEITSELHNLGAEEKGYVLSYHSEKLAIAFGVLATPPGTTIRVAKNIRTCVDCHKFAEFVSAVYNRVVIIRDRTRFHHFREGHCSCNGYW
ncbi:pentatricopeptide repeat-containing protein [Tripterygium wilfordii]|uniref:Pentatricopeptide repeat-containing protein n=1 Tax=Tripterygium wilfordii TaxID=458696 RepID=A0A7J7CJ96_TRIWF|nr:pentatricopeptide repeat-containing protein At3g47530 [Tripterygium wilfordii]KAF5734143.1 pentatricopeptide repeat-containing protein [Tripterygium wilfordii]